jgi:cardiolipin synthase
VLVFGRDLGIIIVAAILYASIGMKDFRPSLFGKANTLAQIVALLTVILSRFYAPPLILLVQYWSLVATVVFTVVSGFHYAWEITRRLSSPTPATGS